MAWVKDRYRELSTLLRGPQPEQDVAEELQCHLQLRTEDNISAGMSSEATGADALRRFGNLEQVERFHRALQFRQSNRVLCHSRRAFAAASHSSSSCSAESTAVAGQSTC